MTSLFNTQRTRLVVAWVGGEVMNSGAVLVLMPQSESRLWLTRIFDENGWSVQQGGTVADARRWLRPDWPGFILTDCDLPDGNWCDILALASAVCPEVKVVVTSRLADEVLWADVLHQGAFDMIAQPLDASEVVRVAASALRHTRRLTIAANA